MARPTKLQASRKVAAKKSKQKNSLKPTPIKGPKGDITRVGKTVDQVHVQFGTRLLQQFSEQLYASPNKAFEELISNSWDAGARVCHVLLSESLSEPDAQIVVIDDGVSMDHQGLHDLWKVAWSNKRDKAPIDGRPPVGKFGIGKLATYALANKLTFVCKADDGVIRAVTMDYTEFSRKPDPQAKKIAVDVKRPMRVLTLDDLKHALQKSEVGKQTWSLLEAGLPLPEQHKKDIRARWREEYGVPAQKIPAGKKRKTWTVAVLGDFKPMGQAIQVGQVRRMLRASLPLGSELFLHFDGEVLEPSKIDVEVIRTWTIGPDLGFNSFGLAPRDGGSDESADLKAKSHAGEEPHMVIPEVGKITGRVTLYRDQIAGGKSDARGHSNGYHVNVLGRVVNSDDHHFGDSNLSHAAWARVRITVRADGLDEFLANSRENFRQAKAIAIMRGFLRRLFNVARSHYESLIEGVLDDPDTAMSGRLNNLPQDSLRSVVASLIEDPESPRSLPIDTEGVDQDAYKKRLRSQKPGSPGGVVNDISFAALSPDEPLSRLRLRDGILVVNSNHAFAEENSTTAEQKRTLKSVALVNLMTDAYAADIGVDPEHIVLLRNYRDRVAATVARLQRMSGVTIAGLLTNAQKLKKPVSLEKLVGDALEYLGFHVTRYGKSGEPEGLAEAKLTALDGGKSRSYSFTYDAKSTQHDKAKTGNLNIAGLQRHRQDHEATYTLVVAPDFQEGALVKECTTCNVTPMRTGELASLVVYAAKFGALPLDLVEEVFSLHEPDEVRKWVVDLEEQIESKRPLTMKLFLDAIASWDTTAPDALSSSVVAEKCRSMVKSTALKNKITKQEVQKLAEGLQAFMPSYISVDTQGQIFLKVSPKKLAETIARQIEDSSPTAGTSQ